MIVIALLLLAGAASPPTAADVEAVEEARVIAPFVNETRTGRRYAEFAPEVETRNARCTEAPRGVYACTWDMRVKGYFDAAFGDWTHRAERLEFRGRCWRTVPLRR
ncbi:MAG TPA: hypothetical protein VGC56_16710 [Allosphingosinicella sp.]|jgi:hypothetical protein